MGRGRCLSTHTHKHALSPTHTLSVSFPPSVCMSEMAPLLLKPGEGPGEGPTASANGWETVPLPSFGQQQIVTLL